MRDASILVLLCLALIAHLLVGTVVLRKISDFAPLVVVNLLVGLALVGYWLGEWYAYLFKGIQWRPTDQLLPLYALAICGLCIAQLAGKNISTALQWCVFGWHALAIVAATLFFAFFKLNKLF